MNLRELEREINELAGRLYFRGYFFWGNENIDVSNISPEETVFMLEKIIFCDEMVNPSDLAEMMDAIEQKMHKLKPEFDPVNDAYLALIDMLEEEKAKLPRGKMTFRDFVQQMKAIEEEEARPEPLKESLRYKEMREVFLGDNRDISLNLKGDYGINKFYFICEDISKDLLFFGHRQSAIKFYKHMVMVWEGSDDAAILTRLYDIVSSKIMLIN